MRAGKLIFVIAIASICSLAVGGAAVAWVMHRPSGALLAQAKSPEVDTRAFKYVSLEKIIVMLRNRSGEPVAHYLALDLVFRTPADNEAITREQLPLLRSVAVQTLSTLTLDAASHATIEDLSKQINQAYGQTYAHDRGGKPFAEALIGKLIIE
jgi:flagellar FliL protein